MSTYNINVPAPDEHDYHADLCQQRRRRALQSLDVGDVIATVEDALAQEPDPKAHPLFPVVNWLLDRQGRVDGGAFWLAWQALVDQAIERLVEARLQGED
jgi:hypothetical protein